MPFKLNQDRRHHIPKQKHKVANWAEYDAALRQRGSLTGHCHTKVDGSGQRAVGQGLLWRGPTRAASLVPPRAGSEEE
jgi:hypothetical protein